MRESNNLNRDDSNLIKPDFKRAQALASSMQKKTKFILKIAKDLGIRVYFSDFKDEYDKI